MMATNEPAAKKRRITLSVGSQEDGDLRQIKLTGKSEVAAIAPYFEYLSTGNIPEPEFCPNDDRYVETYIKLYEFGAQTDDADFCNAIVEALCKHIDGEDSEDGDRNVPSDEIVIMVYSTLPADSLLRNLVAAAHAQFAGSHWFHRREAARFPAEFAWDVLHEMAKCREKGWQGLLERKEQWFK